MLAVALVLFSTIVPSQTPHGIARQKKSEFISCAYNKSRDLLILRETAAAVARASVSLCEQEFIDMREAMRDTERPSDAAYVESFPEIDAEAAKIRQSTLDYVEGEVMEFRAKYRLEHSVAGKLPWE